MSNVTEIEDTGLFSSETLQSCNQVSRMDILQVNISLVELSSTLIAPELRIRESEKCRQLEKLDLHINAEIVNNNSENGNFPEIYTIDTSYQKIENDHSRMLDLIDNHYINKDSQILHQTKPFKQVEVENYLLVDLIGKSERRSTKNNSCKQNTSLQESNQQHENKTPIQNSSFYPMVQTDKIFNPSSLTISTRKESQSHYPSLKASITKEIQSHNPLSLTISTKKGSQSHNPSSLRISTTKESQSHNPSLKTFTTKKIQSHTETIQRRQILANVNADTPMLTYILVKIPSSESRADEYLSILDSMKRIEKWLSKLDELNQYNTTRFQALIEKMVEFKRIESLVQEKQFMLTIGKDLSLLDLQSNLETSTYTSLCNHCDHILRLLKFYGRYLNSAYERHSKLRTRYLDCSLQIAMYPIEEKLFENRKQTMNIINQSSKLMNKMSLKLDETDNYTEILSFQCISVVNNFLSDCEVMFSP